MWAVSAEQAFLAACEGLPAVTILEIVERELGRRAAAERMTASLYEFVKGAWQVLEPELEYLDGWHVEAICLHLQAVYEGRIRRLAISQPAGTAKSVISAVMLNAWVWLTNPRWRLLSGSHDLQLSIRDALRTRDLVTSDWYQETFRPRWGLKVDQNVKSLFHTTEGGFRQAFSLRGKITGHRGDCVLVDDALDVNDRFSKSERDKATNNIKKRLASRLNDKRTNPMLVVGHRLHREDPIGELLKVRWEHLCLAQRFDPATRCSTSIGWSDPRSQLGELLFPALFPVEIVDEIERDELGPSDFEAQQNQNPRDMEGRVWPRSWWRYWTPVPLTPAQRETGRWAQLPDTFDEVIASVDCSFGSKSKTSTSSWTVFQVWARKGAHRYLLDQIRERMSFTRMVEVLGSLRERWPQIRRIYVENKGSGSDAIDWSHERVPGLIPVNPSQDKTARAHAESAPLESGNVFIPDPQRYAWVNDFLDETDNFPGKPDDQVDAASQALRQMHKKQFRALTAATSGALEARRLGRSIHAR